MSVSLDPTGMALDESQAWSAVAARDVSFDGRFVFGVATTGVYCRPGCPARSPRRENVRFFELPADAEHAGFRACMRCHPNGGNPQLDVVAAACCYLQEHAERRVPLVELGRAVGMSPTHLQRTFKRVTGATPREYAASKRSVRLRATLRDSESARAVFDAGFRSTSSAYAASDVYLGMTPARYARAGEGVTIRYALAETTGGQLLAAVTERGVCSIALGDSSERLEERLRAEFHRATCSRDEALSRRVRGVLERPTADRRELSEASPDLWADELCWRVWRVLSSEVGSTFL
ncbi:MAG TPA: Ada metal-binding domain-containing protein [Solirubrobacteraceae bacterium]|nr:Ada metal-binding domain-containing protein [Solirubrobacteraceae bacterium]